MTTILTDIELKLLANIQHGLPLTSAPYKDIAAQTGIDVEDVLRILIKWQSNGYIRRVGAIVNHFKVGLRSGAMVVWQVPHERIDEAGKLFASFSQVSHAYQRPTSDKWPYNIYTMIHGSDIDSVNTTIKQMSEKSGIDNYKQLQTVKELKKVPPTYVI